MATVLRSKFSLSDEELRETLTLDGDLADVSIEGTLRAMVESLKDSRDEFRILDEGDGWIRDIEERMISASDPVLRRELLKSADLIRIVRILTEVAILELADEGVSDEARRTSTESPEERSAREQKRRETILRLIGETIDSQSPGEESISTGSLEYGLASEGNLEHILPLESSEVLSGAWIKSALREDQGDLLVARPEGSQDSWEALSQERMGEIAETIESCCDAPVAPASATMEDIAVELEYGVASYGDLGDIISDQSEGGRLSTKRWAEARLQPEYGDLLVARQAARPGGWSVVPSEPGESPEHGGSDGSSFGFTVPAIDLEEEDGWMAEVDGWIEELSSELTSTDSEEKRDELSRRAELLRALSESTWRLQDLDH